LRFLNTPTEKPAPSQKNIAKSGAMRPQKNMYYGLTKM
jgi:hypothetical protein